MAQPRQAKGERKNGKRVGGQFTSYTPPDEVDAGDKRSLKRLIRNDLETFRSLLRGAAAQGGLDESLVERDYWMCQIATNLIGSSNRYPGSYTSMGGGSLLSLMGVTERVSEDVDISVTYVDGMDKCSSNKSKNLMKDCQNNVEQNLQITGRRDPNGGGNSFRTVRYRYPSVLTPEVVAQSIVKSDKGLRDILENDLMEVKGLPYVGRVAQEHSGLSLLSYSDLAPRPIRGTHPLRILADKLDAVCWREGQVPTEGNQAIYRMADRIRDHYDIHCLIRWLRDNEMLSQDTFLETVERAQEQERKLRAKRRSTRPEQDRPSEGYDTLRAWTPGTAEYDTLSEIFPELDIAVFGELPTYDEVCETVHSAAGLI